MSLPDERYKGFALNTEIVANKDEKGMWKVTHKLSQGRRLGLDKEWETKEIEVTAIDADIDEAVRQAMISITYYLDMVNGDLFDEVKKDEEELLQ